MVNNRPERRSQNGSNGDKNDEHEVGSGKLFPGQDRPAEDEEEEDEQEEESEDEEVEVAVLSRSKRATAGRRLSSLVGKAVEDDQAFWGHDTWKDGDDGSEDGSFHDSDEDSEQRKDTFDSDFDDSENDEQEDENQQTEADVQDAELAKQERKQKQKQQKNRGSGSKASFSVARAARDMMRLNQGGSATGASATVVGGMPRVMGDGINAGIILNLPHPPSSTLAEGDSTFNQLFAAPGVAIVQSALLHPAPPVGSPQSERKVKEGKSMASPAATPSKITSDYAADGAPNPDEHHHHSSAANGAFLPAAAAAARRPPRRATQHSKYASRFRAARGEHNHVDPVGRSGDGSGAAVGSQSQITTTSSAADHNKHHPSKLKRKLTVAERAGEKRKTHRTKFTQEELLLEAVHTTSAENQRWLLGRKRAAEEMETNEQFLKSNLFGGRQKHQDKKLVQRETSKRGTFNVISFFDMDFVPTIFTNHHQETTLRRNVDGDDDDALCVITNKPARYRDPKSLLPYYDSAAFRELRQRLQDGRLKPRKRGQQLKKHDSSFHPATKVTYQQQQKQEQPQNGQTFASIVPMNGDSSRGLPVHEPAMPKAPRGSRGSRKTSTKKEPNGQTSKASTEKTEKSKKGPRKVAPAATTTQDTVRQSTELPSNGASEIEEPIIPLPPPQHPIINVVGGAGADDDDDAGQEANIPMDNIALAIEATAIRESISAKTRIIEMHDPSSSSGLLSPSSIPVTPTQRRESSASSTTATPSKAPQEYELSSSVAQHVTSSSHSTPTQALTEANAYQKPRSSNSHSSSKSHINTEHSVQKTTNTTTKVVSNENSQNALRNTVPRKSKTMRIILQQDDDTQPPSVVALDESSAQTQAPLMPTKNSAGDHSSNRTITEGGQERKPSAS